MLAKEDDSVTLCGQHYTRDESVGLVWQLSLWGGACRVSTVAGALWNRRQKLCHSFLLACLLLRVQEHVTSTGKAEHFAMSPFWDPFREVNDTNVEAPSHPRRCYSGSTAPFSICAQQRSACHATWSGDVAQPASTSSRKFQRRESVPSVSSLEPLDAAHHQECTAASSSSFELGRPRNGKDSTNGSHTRLAAAVFPNS